MKDQRKSSFFPLMYWCMLAVVFAILSGLLFSMWISFYVSTGVR